jgi:acetylornithine deacetylase
MPINKTEVDAQTRENLGAAVELLEALIRYPSTRRNEKEIGRFLGQRLEGLADSVELMPLPDSIRDDPDYSFRVENFRHDGTANLRLMLGGRGKGKSLVFNTHLDVVPPSPGQTEAFSPQIKDGAVCGRGACDAKGQIAVLWLVLKTLRDLGLDPRGDVTLDFVVEEECGGNGTLLVVRQGLQADGAVILEPTDLEVVRLVRGAVWFEVEARGRGGHSGSPGSTASALLESLKVIESIEKLRADLLEVSKERLPEIAGHPNPMPCTFGMLHSGDWPAMTPAEASLKGVFGFLPPFRREDIQAKLRQAVAPYQAEIKFPMLRSDPSRIAENHPLVVTLLEAAAAAGIGSRAGFMNASCDAWRYTEQLGIPAVVFGPGALSAAHSRDERIIIDDIRRAALALIYFIDLWSGLDHAG